MVEWRVKEGDAVAAGDTLLDVTTDKVDVEVPAPAAGTVARIVAAPGETVEVGALLAELSTGNGAAPAGGNGGAPPATAEPEAPAAEPRPRPAEPQAAPEPEAAPAAARRGRGAGPAGPDRPPRHGVGDRGHRRRVARRRRRRRRGGADPAGGLDRQGGPRGARARRGPHGLDRGRGGRDVHRRASRWGTSRPAPPARRPPRRPPPRRPSRPAPSPPPRPATARRPRAPSWSGRRSPPSRAAWRWSTASTPARSRAPARAG